MVTVFDMKTGRLVSQSHNADVVSMADSGHSVDFPQPALQTIQIESAKPAGMPPELAHVRPDDFLNRWRK